MEGACFGGRGVSERAWGSDVTGARRPLEGVVGIGAVEDQQCRPPIIDRIR